MDLSTISPAIQSIAIRHPSTGKDTGLVIDVMSLDSPPVQKVMRDQRDATMRTRTRKITAEQIDDNILDQLVAAVAGWRWIGDAAWGGKALEFTPENVRTVVKTAWVRRQLEEAVADEAAFFGS